jgi:hypothetical protein
MASNLTPLADQTRHMVAQTKTLLNEQLRKVLKEEGLVVSGVKTELQLRIINRTVPRSPPSSPTPRLLIILAMYRHIRPSKCRRYHWDEPSQNFSLFSPQRIFRLFWLDRHKYSSLLAVTSISTACETDLSVELQHASTFVSKRYECPLFLRLE